jgi:hypothetical protein
MTASGKIAKSDLATVVDDMSHRGETLSAKLIGAPHAVLEPRS